jgi:hypothetical protein
LFNDVGLGEQDLFPMPDVQTSDRLETGWEHFSHVTQALDGNWHAQCIVGV